MSSPLSELKNHGVPIKDDRRIFSAQKRGYWVTVGKNSFSNDRMISDHKSKHPDCLWLHATACRGCHVILCTYQKAEPNEEVLNFAAALALKHSRSEARTVSVSILSDVFKPEDAALGVWKSARFYSMDVPE